MRALRIFFFAGALVLAAAACGGGDDSNGTGASTGGTSPSKGVTTKTTRPPTTTTTTPPEPDFSFTIDERGFTARHDIYNLEITRDINARVPIGYEQILVTFDWTVTNTTPGRENGTSGVNASLFIGGTDIGLCSSGGTCDEIVASFGAKNSLPPDASISGSYDSNEPDPFFGPSYAAVKEGTPDSALFFGNGYINCVGVCWYSLSGAPVPTGLCEPAPGEERTCA